MIRTSIADGSTGAVAWTIKPLLLEAMHEKMHIEKL